MSDMYKKIKKQNGEAFAQALRTYHNGLFEIPDIDQVVRHAGRDAAPLLSYLMTLLATNDDVPPPPAIQDPFVLLSEAGYDAFYADTLQKQNSIANYFQAGELLCTFNDSARHKDYHIVHAVRKDVAAIKRADFKGKEQREDAYGTSVISIQMLKRGGFISIKNRYNHAVDSCDNTFNSNPDNIIEGLSAALKTHFDVEFTALKQAMPDGYTLINSKIFKYHTEHNNIYYGDRAWGHDGMIHEVNIAAGDAMFDKFVFDNTSKTLKKINPQLNDGFADDFNRDYGGNRGLTVRNGNLILSDDVLIGADKSRIKTVYLPALTTMGDDCLYDANALIEFSAHALTTMGYGCLSDARALTHFIAPALTTMGKCCLYDVPVLMQLSAPALTTMGNECLQDARALTHFTAPALTTIGNYCLNDARALTHFTAPALTTMGNDCLQDARALTHFTAPALTTMGNYCLNDARALTHFTAPVLTVMGDECLHRANVLTQFNAPVLTTMGHRCLCEVSALTYFSTPTLTTMGLNCLCKVTGLTHFSAPALTAVADHFLSTARALAQFEAERLIFVPPHLKRFVKEREAKPTPQSQMRF